MYMRIRSVLVMVAVVSLLVCCFSDKRAEIPSDRLANGSACFALVNNMQSPTTRW